MSQVQNEECKLVPTKMVFKIKHEQNGTHRYKTQIVTKGFMMIPGVNYMESFSPVTTEAGICTVIGVSQHFINEDIAHDMPEEQKWVLEVYDVKAAFLNANPGTKMYIKILEKMVALGFVTKEEQRE